MATRLPNPFIEWITLRGSMTRALGQQLGGRPTVVPSFEDAATVAPWETRLLRAAGRRGYVRTVTLSVANQPVVLARTVSRLKDPAVNVLRTLSNRPLADVLFTDHRWQRISPPIPLLLAGETYGRACLWQYGLRNCSRILVEEFFLRALIDR